MPKYHGHFKSRADVVACYDESRVPPEEEIVYAYHTEPDYSESLTVIWVSGGVFYEVDDGHCSCNGWDEDGTLWAKPELTSVGALLMRESNNQALMQAVGEALTRLAAAEASVPRVTFPSRRALALTVSE